MSASGTTAGSGTDQNARDQTAGLGPWVEQNHPDKTGTAFLAEYDNSGPGYTPDERIEWVRQLTDEEAEPYLDVETVFGGWNPEECL